MLSGKKLIITILLIIVITSRSAFADWKEDAKAIDISGGEDHTLILTKNKFPWGCGNNETDQLGLGDNAPSQQKTLVRVHGPNDIGYLEDINDIDAGWTHSLALDVNGLVWAWGRNIEGQLGNNSTDPCATPVQVHGPNDVGCLENIIAISAGRSGNFAEASHYCRVH